MKNKVKLFPHQEEGLRRVLKEPFYLLFMEQGTGKTPVAIKAMEEAYLAGEIHRVIIYAPKTLLYNWELEINKFLSLPEGQYSVERLNQRNKSKRVEAFNNFIKQDLTFNSLAELKQKGYKGTKQDILNRLEKPPLMILLVNYEKASIMTKELRKYNPLMLIVDECHKLRNHNTGISKNIYKTTRKCKRRLLMTGTPICNGLEDLFMQYKITNEDILGGNYKQFEEEYIVKGGYMGYEIKGYKNEGQLKEIVSQTSYRVKLADCVKLPPKTIKYLYCELPDKAQRVYNQMKEDMLAEVENHKDISRKKLKQVCKKYGIPYRPKESYLSLFTKASSYLNTSSCEITLTQMLRLHQICGGFITTDDGEIVNLGTEKLKVVKEEVLESKQPVVIFCQYVPEIDQLEQELSKLKKNKKPLRVGNYRDPKTRDKVYKQFTDGDLDVILLQLRSGSVGLNLQRASKLILYSWNFSSDDYVQALARIIRNGQKNHMSIMHLVAEGTIDEYLLESISSKRKIADSILD